MTYAEQINTTFVCAVVGFSKAWRSRGLRRQGGRDVSLDNTKIGDIVTMVMHGPGEATKTYPGMLVWWATKHFVEVTEVGGTRSYRFRRRDGLQPGKPKLDGVWFKLTDPEKKT